MNQQKIYELMEKFSDSEICEIKIEEAEGFKITLKKPSTTVNQNVQAVQTSLPTVPQQAVASPTHEKEVSKSSDSQIITAPVIGTFYRSAAPDAPAFVEEGSTVKTGDTICIIEAMKIMNKLEADYDCQIVKILVENGQAVEFGTELFEVKKL